MINRCEKNDENIETDLVQEKVHVEDVNCIEATTSFVGDTECKSLNIDKRDEWTNKVEYMLSVIGYVVDLGNCVRFPYVRNWF